MVTDVESSTDKDLSWCQSYCPFLLNALTVPYGLLIRGRNQLYEHGWLTQHRLPRPVISVGNLTVGGTGKTPIVMWVANWLRGRGKRVAILSRGYRRKHASEFLLVSDGQKCLTSPAEGGDEPFLMAQRCPEVVIAVGKKRYELGLWVLNQVDVDCFVLDDGFQHLRLHRDCNLLLVDALDERGLAGMLPVGRLREPICEARRATAILLTRMDQASRPSAVLNTLQSGLGKSISPIHVQFFPCEVINVRTGQVQSGDWFSGKHAVIVSGIGNALSFRQTVQQMGVTILETFAFPDHFSYSDDSLDAIRRQAQRRKAEIIVTTEKDSVKLTPLLKEDKDWWAIRLETNIQKGEEQLLTMLGRISMGS